MTIIRATLMAALKTYAGSHDPVLTIAREGDKNFKKPTDLATFLEPFFIPANTTSPTLAGERRRFWGDFQINVWTKDGCGAGEGEEIAEEISQLFKVYPKDYLPVSIEAPASIKRPLPDESGYRVTPILIPYRMESEN